MDDSGSDGVRIFGLTEEGEEGGRVNRRRQRNITGILCLWRCIQT